MSDPYPSFRVHLRMDGAVVAGFTKATGLERGPDGQPITSGAIVLSRGISTDADFIRWAAPGLSAPQPRDLALDLYNEAGQRVVSDRLVEAWVAAVTSDLGVEDQVLYESLTLQCQSWTQTP